MSDINNDTTENKVESSNTFTVNNQEYTITHDNEKGVCVKPVEKPVEPSNGGGAKKQQKQQQRKSAKKQQKQQKRKSAKKQQQKQKSAKKQQQQQKQKKK